MSDLSEKFVCVCNKAISWAQTAALIASLTVTGATSAWAGILFADNFDDERSLKNYTVKRGHAWVEDQRLNTQGGGWPRDSVVLLKGNPQWTDFELSVKVQPLAGWHQSRIFFRTQDFDWSSAGTFGKGYSLHLSKETGWGPYEIGPGEPVQFDWVQIYRQECPPHSRCDATSLGGKSFIPVSVPVDVRISVNGGNIQVFLNGVKQLEVTDPSPLPPGGIGLGAIWETLATFDDLAVRDAVPLASFNPRAEFTLGPKANDDSYWVRGLLKLGAASNGIDPMNEPVSIKVGNFSHTVPAGSFVQHGAAYSFSGPVGPSTLDVKISPMANPGTYWFKSCLRNGDLEATTMKPPVQLTIGDDQGQAALDVGYAKFGKGADGQKWVFPPAK